MTMISPFEMKPNANLSEVPGAAKLRAVFNRGFMILALPISLLQLPFAMRRKRLTGQRQPFLIRSPFDDSGFAPQLPAGVSQVDRLRHLAAQLEADDPKANRETINELNELIGELA